MLEALFARIDDQREALVELTRELIQIPTINPPGDAYRACARLLGTRLGHAGFDVSYQRAEGQTGDSERYPRVNVIARYEGRAPGACVHFNGHLDVVEPGHGWSVNPFAGVVRQGRLYGRGACDMKGGIAAAVIALESILASGIRFAGALEMSGTVDEESGGHAGVAWLAEPGLLLAAAGRSRDHSRAARRRPDLHRAPRRLVGRDRDLRPDRARLDAVPRRLRDPPHGRVPQPHRAPPAAEARRTPDRDAGGAARGAPVDDLPQRGPRRPRRGPRRPAQPAGRGQLPPGARPALPARGGPRRGQGGDHRDARAVAPRPARGSAIGSAS